MRAECLSKKDRQQAEEQKHKERERGRLTDRVDKQAASSPLHRYIDRQIDRKEALLYIETKG